MGKELGIEPLGDARSLAPPRLKGLGRPTGTVPLTPNKNRVAEDRRDCYWLYVVTDRDTTPRPQVSKDLASLPWHEVERVDHYWLSVDAMRELMRVREREVPYGGGS